MTIKKLLCQALQDAIIIGTIAAIVMVVPTLTSTVDEDARGARLDAELAACHKRLEARFGRDYGQPVACWEQP